MSREEEKNYEQRLVWMLNFINNICIDGGCGLDLKEISRDIIKGKLDYIQAIEKWQNLGHYLL